MGGTKNCGILYSTMLWGKGKREREMGIAWFSSSKALLVDHMKVLEDAKTAMEWMPLDVWLVLDSSSLTVGGMSRRGRSLAQDWGPVYFKCASVSTTNWTEPLRAWEE